MNRNELLIARLNVVVVFGSDTISNGQKEISIISIESRKQVTIGKNASKSNEIKNLFI